MLATRTRCRRRPQFANRAMSRTRIRLFGLARIFSPPFFTGKATLRSPSAASQEEGLSSPDAVLRPAPIADAGWGRDLRGRKVQSDRRRDAETAARRHRHLLRPIRRSVRPWTSRQPSIAHMEDAPCGAICAVDTHTCIHMCTCLYLYTHPSGEREPGRGRTQLAWGVRKYHISRGLRTSGKAWLPPQKMCWRVRHHLAKL